MHGEAGISIRAAFFGIYVKLSACDKSNFRHCARKYHGIFGTVSSRLEAEKSAVTQHVMLNHHINVSENGVKAYVIIKINITAALRKEENRLALCANNECA